MMELMHQSWLMATMALFIVVISLTSWLYMKRFSFWSDRGVKGPRPYPLFGNSLSFMYDSTASIDAQHRQEYGHVYGIFEGSTPILMIHDPVILQQVYKNKYTDFAHRLSDKEKTVNSYKSKNFLYANGEDMMKISRTISDSFKERPLAQSMDRIDHKDVLLTLRASAGQPVNIGEVFLPFCFNVGAGTTYGIDLDMYNNEAAGEIIAMAEQVSILGMPIISLPYSKYWMVQRLPLFFSKMTGMIPDGQKAHEYFATLIREAFARAENEKSGDMAESFSKALKSGLLTEDQVLNNSINIIGANAFAILDLLSFVMYAMAKYPEHQELVLNEMIAAHGDFSNLKYFTAFIYETLRLFPIEVRTYRHVTSESGATVPGTDIHLPKGTCIGIPIYSLQRDPAHWQEPEKFDPKRFLPENKDQLVDCAFVSFGAGQRSCPGVVFVLKVIKVMIAPILREFELTNASPKNLDLRINARMAAFDGIPLSVAFRRREK